MGSFHLGVVCISGILFNLCCDGIQSRNGKTEEMRCWSIQSVLATHKVSVQTFQEMLSKQERNELIHAICINAQLSEMESADAAGMDLLDGLPRHVVSIQSLPLITGYVRT